MNERFIAIEQTMTSGQQIPLKPPLTLMFAEDFHDPAIGRKLLIIRFKRFQPCTAGDVKNAA